MTDPIKAKIQELCPDVMELKEGCQVMAGLGEPMLHTIYGYDNGSWMAFLNHPFPKALEANDFYDCEFAEGADGVEILGSPITLAVVLRVIGNTREGEHADYAVDEMGRFRKRVEDGDFKWIVIKQELIAWDLEHDNYDQQSEDCKQFIGSLLGI